MSVEVLDALSDGMVADWACIVRILVRVADGRVGALPDAHILFRNRMRRSLRAAHRVVFESNFEPLEVLGGEACTIPLRKHMPATN